ncbi:Xanthan lyase precursor [Rubripirellula lacrimiformis]|uniref:Xanthan lyase n=1 Tax=Rubripirellula lacrimiformis TaxID=1930273 RepID=A0A517N552_9BACT|nr:FAD-dependent oxidoreductase [Rubripirellula lacrimiformis]QDT02260.1 Xanthan lyase precursor [Rubripirellula lacrimiformis]
MLNPVRWLLALAAALIVPHLHIASADEATVVVYGATPGGFCAAIAAAREGASVTLLEPTSHVGGVNTGGLSFSDSNQTVRSTVMGLFDEWHTRIQRDYADRGIELPYKVSVKDQSHWTYEPHVAARVTQQMLDEAKVVVLTNRYLDSVTKDGSRITSLVTNDGAFDADVYIDASYEGDLMAAAGVSWTIGREGRSEFGESLAGKQYPKAKLDIDGFDADGNLLPLITTMDAGPADEGDSNVMVYSFRLCLTADPENRVPFPEPTDYDPGRFEVVRRYLEKGGSVGWDMYPLPNGKLDGNNSIGGQFSLGLVGACNGWCEADQAGRVAIWEAHKQYTLEFYHFLTTDPSVSETTRAKYARLGLCKDEFPEYGHFSPALYVREGRRMRGQYVLRQKDILDDPVKHDPIVISSFPIDSHDCQRVAIRGGGVINEGTIFPVRKKYPKQGYAYQVPYRSILPHSDQASNLLVPVALSCTHVGISSIRVEPTWMILGQSAGIAAAMAASSEVAVQDLPYPKLRQRLLDQGQVLELPPEEKDPSIQPGVLDDAGAAVTGTWKHSTNFKSFIGQGYLHDDAAADGKATAVFRYRSKKAGPHTLSMAYSAHETRATNVPVSVTSGPHQVSVTVDQTQPIPSGQLFRTIGTVDLVDDMDTVIRITNSGTNGFVILDAVKLVLVAD